MQGHALECDIMEGRQALLALGPSTPDLGRQLSVVT